MVRIQKYGLSDKEVQVISFLESKSKRFFKREDICSFFNNYNTLTLFLRRLLLKGRVVRISKRKYFLVPIYAKKSWVEHSFIVADELFDGKDYYIGGKAAAHYWGLIDQIPTVIDIFSKTKQGTKEILGTKFCFRRIRKFRDFVEKKIKEHSFLIATKKESRKWI